MSILFFNFSLIYFQLYVNMHNRREESEMTIGENIKRIREEKDITQEELSARLGYKTKSSISKIEKGAADFPMAKLRRIADALGVDVWEIIGFNEVEMDEAEPRPELDALVELLRTLSPEELRRVHDFALGLIAARQ
jgi:transcriptional regulator with XRE-family HTH domain